MLTSSEKIKNCYLPVLQSSGTLEDTKRMIRNNKTKKPDKGDLDGFDKNTQNANIFVGNDRKFCIKKQKIIQDIDIINKHVMRKEIEHQKLNQANVNLEKKNSELKRISEELKQRFQSELKDKLSVLEDNHKLASKLKHLAKTKGEAVDDKKYEMLVATIKDKDTKLVKLTELIAPLRKKLKEQEGLVGELSLARSENKGLMEVNEEIVREMASLNDRHAKATNIKDKQIALLQTKCSRLMEESKRILDSEKTGFAGQGAQMASERRRLEEMKRNVESDTLALEDIKSSLTEEREIIEESKKLIDEENIVIEDEKRVIDEEWGDIVRKKKEIKDTENEFSDKVKSLLEENEIAAGVKAVLELELNQTKDELLKVKCQPKLSDQMDQLRKTKEKKEYRLKEEISIKDGMIQDLEFQVGQEVRKKKEQREEHENAIQENKEEIEILKSRIGVLNNNNKRKRSEEDCCSNSKKSKPSEDQEEIEHCEGISEEVIISNVTEVNGEELVDSLSGEEVDYVLVPVDVDTEEDESSDVSEPNEVNSDSVTPGDESESCELIAAFLGGDTATANASSEVVVTDSRAVDTTDADSLGIETTATDATVAVAIDNDEGFEIPVDVVNADVVDTNTCAIALTDTVSVDDDFDVPKKDESALKLIAAMNDFESLIKSSRSQDTLDPEEKVAQPELVKNSAPELDKANQLIRQVEDIIGQTKIINIINTAKKTESIRDVFDDSEEESEEEGGTTNLEPVTVQELPVSSCIQQTIKVRDMTTICESENLLVDRDVIIPTDSSGDLSLEISVVDEAVEKKAAADAAQLRSQVTDVVKLSLSKFYQIVDGVQTMDDLENLTARFSKQFSEEIISSHLEKQRSTAGITMTRVHKRALVDQIIFYFEIKKSVNLNLGKHIHPTTPQFVYLSSELSNQFSKEIMESHSTMFNSLQGLSLTPDNHQWIGNIISFKMSQSQK